MMTLAWIAAALAGSVYINGVRADVLPETTLEDVTVRIDAQGNLYIDAPGYRARVVTPPGYATPTPAPTYTPPPSASSYVPPASPAPAYVPPPGPPTYVPPGTSTSTYTPPPAASTYTPPASTPSYAPPAPTPSYTPPAPTPSYTPPAYTPPAATPAPAPTPWGTTAASAPPAAAAPRPVSSSASALAGTWWLISEDNDSTGHDIEVMVNGVLVQRIRSGDAQVLLDLGPSLHPGSNTILVRALPSAGLGGGVLSVYVGRGSNIGGTLRVDEPQIRYARRATDRPAGASQTFTLNVP